MDKYRTAWRRVGAAMLDSLILSPVGMLAGFFAVIVGPGRASALISAAVTGFVSVFYYIWLHGKYGQTLGKMVAKVKVLDERETPIDFNHAILRSLPQLIPAMYSTAFFSAESEMNAFALVFSVLLGAFSVMDVLFFLCTDRHRALHDVIARTVVVRTDP